MSDPRFIFVKKDAGSIKDWLKERLDYLIAHKLLIEAHTLCKEFDVSYGEFGDYKEV